ncbi:hypothetical protein LX16_0766 [Stackebrandtia albiflava]|uniref:Uncharacterized protein n=1 Tax=Stackebrandtia albiflava TaxID=406432 RepID=A0A562VB46_9ACTN|nr:hypothetical protein [Stackebrandtia albiflava]TWJ15068.1 hypothetical protein LX16_0766 [Stackebrandtia albiflava]
MTDEGYLLVFPERASAESVARAVSDRYGPDDRIRVVRESLAGEDDAEDAQWLVPLHDPRAEDEREWLADLASAYDGWLETA